MSSGVINIAKDLRNQDPQRYGVPRSTKGTPGYVPQGWRQAVTDAGQLYRQRKTEMLARDGICNSSRL